MRLELGAPDMMRAREFSRAKRFDEARAACQAAISLFDSARQIHGPTCLAAVIELKAKNASVYEELVAEAEKGANIVCSWPTVSCARASGRN